MRSITIHDMDPELASRLERRAREAGLSLNKAIKGLLAQALGLGAPAPSRRRGDFDSLCGVWSRREAAAFAKAAHEFERIDREDWA